MKTSTFKKSFAVMLSILMVMSLLTTFVSAADPVAPIPGVNYYAGLAAATAPTIDSAVTDAAWTEGWKTVNGSNGLWQNPWAEGKSPSDLAFDYNLKWDANGLYLAVKINKAPVNNTGAQASPAYQTTATNVRLWLDTDMATPAARSHLYDYNFAADGTVSLLRSDGGAVAVTMSGSKTDTSCQFESFIPYSALGVTSVANIGFWLTTSAPGLDSAYVDSATITGDEGYNALNIHGWSTDNAVYQTTAGYDKIIPDNGYFYLEAPLDAFNKKIAGGDISIFTETLGTAVTAANGNPNWANSIVAVWDAPRQAYVVTEKVNAPGASASITIPEGGIVLTIHSDGLDANKYQKLLTGDVQVGYLLKLSKIDMEAETFEAGAKIEIVPEVGNTTYGAALVREGAYSENIAAGKTYTANPAPASGYPDADNKELTDGLLNTALSYTDAAWSGYLGATNDFVIDLGAQYTNLGDFAMSAYGGGDAGIFAPQALNIYVSDDGINYTYVAGVYHEQEASGTGDEAADFYDVFEYNVSAEKLVSGRYVKFSVVKNATHGWTFLGEMEVYTYTNVQKLYVTAINDAAAGTTTICNPVGDTADDLEGAGVIELSTVDSFTFAWKRVVVFKYNETLGAYVVKEVLNPTGGSMDNAPLTLADDEFAYTTNTGNDYIALWAGLTQAQKDALAETDWQYSWQFKQNHITTQIVDSHNAIAALVADTPVYLYNINLETGAIVKSFSYKSGDPAVQTNVFNAFIAVGYALDEANDYYKLGNTSDLGALEPENIALGATYVVPSTLNSSYPDTDSKELTDGIFAAGDPADANWVGFSGADSHEIIFDLGEAKEGIAKLNSSYLHLGWGIGAPVSVSYYASVDGVNFFYVGDGTYETELATEEGFASYNCILDLPVGITARYIKLVATRNIPTAQSFVFISEFEAFTNTAEPAAESEAESDVSDDTSDTTPITGDADIVIAIFALVIAAGCAIVIKKRHA
ncbi:MAG: hypothetical protein A2Y17_00155 [Clostridiales bacterium GWF2_38_85]|nr:MAG: hypothetical protein A2Y17_00155 [Clostridiales bacterium GWF2_38_85]HBL83872.1 hypothetical protein [Clostridiales bacterium]